MWRTHRGAIPAGFDVHHIDGDQLHNALANLECLSRREHRAKSRSNAGLEYDKSKTMACSVCGTVFATVAWANAKYCSPACNLTAWRRRDGNPHRARDERRRAESDGAGEIRV
jgi:hypothetical protein